MKFLHVCWFRRVIKLNKSVSHLIIDVIMPVQVNLLIDNELLFHSELKNCELYHNDCRLTQCFNCQKYDHTVKVCHNTQKCDVCATLEHSNHDCSLKSSFFLNCCVNCNLKHSAWFTKCKVCKEQLKKTWLIYINKFRKFIIMINNKYSVNMCLLTFFLFIFL
jgi:hypothetical protein